MLHFSMMLQLISEHSDRPSVVSNCLSKGELQQFLDLIAAPYEWVGDTILLIHATAGPVIWEWAPAMQQFCTDAI